MAEIEIVRDELGSEKKVKIVRDHELGSETNGVKSMNKRPKYDDIPAWILTEVLITMPLKLVFRSKLVSKHWLSVISHPSFALTYTLHASKSSILQPWTFIYSTIHVEGSQGSRLVEGSQGSRLGDLYDRNIIGPSVHILHRTNPDQKSYRILGVSNGLLLYGPCIEGDLNDAVKLYLPFINVGDWVHSVVNYSIYNPITKKRITLPPHGCLLENISNGFITPVENGILTSYRVVRSDMFNRNSNSVIFEVFVSEIGEWKEFDVYIDQEIRFVRQERHISLNEILHWMTRKHGIMAYDPYHSPHKSRIIALPDGGHLRTDMTHIDVFQGRLRYFKLTDGRGIYYSSHGFASISVWILNDYNAGDWSLQHTIDSSDILYDSILQGERLFLNLISFHPFDGDIVYFGYRNILVSYNLKTQEMEAHGGPISNKVISPCWSWTFLFVVPPWPVNIPHPHPFSHK